MVKEIIKDQFFLARKSILCTKDDLYIAKDLRDTLEKYKDSCVGMAANMIGYSKNMIIVSLGIKSLVMINPKILNKKFPYEIEEGCLSLVGTKNVTRYREITLEYQDETLKIHTGTYSGFVAEIIQHEMDHLDGILI